MPPSTSHRLPGRARVGLDDVGDVVLNSKLDVDQTEHLELLGDLDSPLADGLVDRRRQRLRRDAAGRVSCRGGGELKIKKLRVSE
jgi:hypothetical protein